MTIVLFVTTRTQTNFQPPQAVVRAMHHGFVCWAEEHRDWPKSQRYEWLCRRAK